MENYFSDRPGKNRRGHQKRPEPEIEKFKSKIVTCKVFTSPGTLKFSPVFMNSPGVAPDSIKIYDKIIGKPSRSAYVLFSIYVSS